MARLRDLAILNGRSVEEEARLILRVALRKYPEAPENLAESIRKDFADVGGLDIELPPREMGREPPDFSGPEFDFPDEGDA